ncbi:MAG TPA: hypothetical protein VGG08_11970 [Solirubrobacteraceae bacterium]|jgi:hypothetical protein
MPDLDATAHYARLPGARREGPSSLSTVGLALARNFDVLVVLIAAAPAIALGAPAFGYVVGAVAWIAQSLLEHADKRWIARSDVLRSRFGVNLFEAFGRIWLLAGAIVLAGVAGGRPDGLTCAVIVFVCYSVAFAIRVVSGRPGAGGTEQ